MKLSDFDYSLQKDLIAQEPIRPRSNSRLMVVKKNRIEHKHFYNILDYLHKGDVLVINETKVLAAKLIGKKETGAKAELIITGKKGKHHLARIMTKNPQKGNIIELEENLKAKIIDVTGENNEVFVVEFFINNKSNQKQAELILNKIGQLPTPSYIKKKLENNSDYQTIYSKKEGSVAAPTAGLHFTDEILKKIREKEIKIARICLHVGFGTFLPIRDENVLGHRMEKEIFEINNKNAKIINECKGDLIAVGTTSLKTVESACDESGNVRAMKSESNLFITPEYKLKSSVSRLMTNFHLPKSTLILLVSCFAGRKTVLNAYKIAIKKKYRFYSFGDAMLLERAT